MTDEKAVNIIKQVIEILEKEGLVIDSPYELELFAEKYLCNHSLIFKTGKFIWDGED